jgi:hypothetical protein
MGQLDSNTKHFMKYDSAHLLGAIYLPAHTLVGLVVHDRKQPAFSFWRRDYL